MKRNPEELNLRDAFPEEPEFCHAALMAAARSVKEEKKMKRNAFRVALAAALILLATMAAAVAAGRLLGFADFFGQYGAQVPETAQRMMGEAWNRHEYALGPVRFTTQELLCDGHVALASTMAAMDDSSDALICAEPFDAIGANGENGKQTAQRLGVPLETTWMEAARLLGRRLYAVRAILELPAALDSGSAMEDILFGEDGGAVVFSMPELLPGASGETLAMQLYLSVTGFDVETGTAGETMQAREPLNVYLDAPLEACAYAADGALLSDSYVLSAVQAELTSLGLYLTSTFTAPEGATEDDVYARDLPLWLDAQGEPLPEGIALSVGIDAGDLPVVRYTQMFSVESLPKKLIMRTGEGEEVVLTR